MNLNKAVKFIAIVFAVIIMVLLAILIFVNPPGPAVSRTTTEAPLP